jgi:MscS family membrane protein
MNRRNISLWFTGLLTLMAFQVFTHGAPVQTNTLAVATGAQTNGAPQLVFVKPPPQVWLTFGLNKVEPLQGTFLGIPIWQYLASLLYIFLAFYVSKFLDFIIRERLQKWARKTKTPLDDIIVELLRGPIKVISFVVLLHIGMEVYSWPEGFSEFLSTGLKIIVAASIMYVLLKAVDLLMGVWRSKQTTPENEQFSKQLLPLIGKTLKVFLVIVVLLVTSQNLGFNVTGLIASLSIGGLAIGLAAQDTLANLFGAVAVLVDKPFKVGDRIQVEGADGTVESIGFRSTRIRNLDGFLVTVPNKMMGNSRITNVTMRPTIKNVMSFGLTYDTPSEKVQRAVAIITEVFRSSPQTADLIVGFDKFTDSTLNIQVIHWWQGTDFKVLLRFLQDCNLEIKTRFDQEKIEFAFPTQTLYLKTEQQQLPPLEPEKPKVST